MGSFPQGPGFLHASQTSSPLGHVSKGLQKHSTAGFKVPCQDVPFPSSLTAVNVLNVLIEKVIFENILGINRTLDNKLPPHCSSIDYFNQIFEVLFGFEASHKLSVIWRSRQHRRETTALRTLNNHLLKTFRINKMNNSFVIFFLSMRLQT